MTQGTNNQYVQAKSENGQNVHFQSRRDIKDGTAGRIGKEYGVDERTIRRDAEYASGLDDAEKVSPGVKQAVLSGEVKAPKKAIAAIRNMSDVQKRENELHQRIFAGEDSPILDRPHLRGFLNFEGTTNASRLG